MSRTEKVFAWKLSEPSLAEDFGLLGDFASTVGETLIRKLKGTLVLQTKELKRKDIMLLKRYETL